MEKIIGIGVLIALTFTSTVYILSSDYFTKSQKAILGILFVFPPAQWILAIILVIWNKNSNLSIGFNTDKSDNQIDELRKLRDKNILTKEEYETKVNKIIEREQTESFKKSNDYKTLEKLKNNGILTEEEFEDKSEILKNRVLKQIARTETENESVNAKPYYNDIGEQDDFLGGGFYWVIIIAVVVIMLGVALIDL